jgi:DNA repair photolyase
MFYYGEEPCRPAMNRVKGMGFTWSMNPYMGCAHRCAFCYVRGFERRARISGQEAILSTAVCGSRHGRRDRGPD